jgi:hypothetical protein
MRMEATQLVSTARGLAASRNARSIASMHGPCGT